MKASLKIKLLLLSIDLETYILFINIVDILVIFLGNDSACRFNDNL